MGSPETKRLSYGLQIEEEAKTWCIEDPARRAEKMQRERIRHHKLIRDLLLDKLETGVMHVCEIGGGPEPVSDLFPFRHRMVIDPCTKEYAKFFPVPDHVDGYAEDVLGDDLLEETFDLVIATNSLDHVRDESVVLSNVYRVLKPGGYFAVMCAENNAITNPHPCHTINLTAKDIHRWCDQWAETVWELTYQKDGYRYGWAEYAGRVGQPAFAMLLRKVVGYD
jgi:SAM-dependent methyltransferase